ncbi:hypothetical protein [Serratia phage PCH45]|uniref:hypothetical protein n=1 Tax=Serratia phage PCH45 TaxID=2608368 RepID=UPI0012A937A5|nr:hypothetical protein [Serratia phage PCH45]
MKRIVIAINNSEFSNQFALNDFHGVINNPKHGKVEYFIHRNPMMKISPVGGLKSNFDVLINNPYPGESTEGADFISLLKPHQLFTNKREAKSIMRHRLNSIGPYYKGFTPIPAWKTTDPLLLGQSGGWGNDIAGMVVLKDEHGARGAGQVLFYVGDHSPACVIRAIKDQAEKLHELEEKPRTDQEIIDDIKKVIPNVKLGYDLNVGIRETVTKLSTNGTYIEQFVPGVKEEFRILLCPGNHYVFSREIENVDGYKQACGSKGGMRKPVTDPRVLAVAADAVELLNKAGVVYGSADLFVTDEGWGIFEYSSQFAANGVASEYSREIQTGLINHVIEKFLDGEK